MLFFSNSRVASLSKQLFYIIVSDAAFSRNFNHLGHSLNTSHKSIPQCRNRPLARYAGRLVRSSARRTPSTSLLQYRNSVTQDPQIKQCTITLGVPNSMHLNEL